MSDKYFANKPTNERAAVILEKAAGWGEALETSGYMEKLRLMWKSYYGIYFSDSNDSHSINFSGEQGEITQIAINHMHNISKIMLNMITAVRPTMIAKSVNSDYKSLVQTKLANGLLDYYMRDHRVENYLKRAVESAIVLGAGYVKLEWNATKGEVYEVDEELGIEIKEGDLEFSNLYPFDVYFDTHREDHNHDWVIARSWKNRYDLAAKYPEFAEEILKLPTKNEINNLFAFTQRSDDTDLIAVYEFYHKRTDSVPDGLYQLLLSDTITLLESPMPYRSLPIYAVRAGEYLGTPFAYTPMFDLLPIQDAINSLYSAVLTNQSAFAVQNILVPQNANIQISELAGALNAIEYNPALGEIKPLQLTATPQEVFSFIKMLEEKMSEISGINSVSRGTVPENLRSGNALALVQSMSLQYISGLQQSYAATIEDLGTGIINTLKDHASVPRIKDIMGKHNLSYSKEFTGHSLSSINRVIVEVANPLANTTAGRLEIAQQMLQMGAIKTPENYFTVMNTGSLDTLTDPTFNQNVLIRAENERLIANEPVAAVYSDEHALHIKGHAEILADPALRFDVELFNRVQAHMQEHIELLKNTDPNILMILGQQPIQQAPPPPQPGMDINQGQVPEDSIQGQQSIDMQMQAQGVVDKNMPNIPQPPPETQVNSALQEQQQAILNGGMNG